jgi:DNA polymerase
MNLTREEVYIANVLKCRPPENRKPTPDEEEKCLPYLIEQVKILQPKAIVALGAVAVQALLKLDIGISKMRGNWYEFSNIPLMPTFHPSYLLRNQSLEIKRLVWEDMLQVMKKLGHPITPKQQAFFKTNAP